MVSVDILIRDQDPSIPISCSEKQVSVSRHENARALELVFEMATKQYDDLGNLLWITTFLTDATPEFKEQGKRLKDALEFDSSSSGSFSLMHSNFALHK